MGFGDTPYTIKSRIIVIITDNGWYSTNILTIGGYTLGGKKALLKNISGNTRTLATISERNILSFGVNP